MTSNEKAHKVLQLIEYRQDAIDKMVETVAGIYGDDQVLDEDQYKEKHETLGVLAQVCDETIDPVLDKVAQAYAKHYTDQELEELAAWYASPLGQKVLAESKTLLVDVSGVLEAWGTAIWKVVRLRRGWQENKDS